MRFVRFFGFRHPGFRQPGCTMLGVGFASLLAGALLAAEPEPGPAPLDAAALRGLVARFDLRQVELPSNWEKTRASAVALHGTAPESIAQATAVLRRLVADQGWKESTGPAAPMVTAEYAQVSFRQQGCELQLYISLAGDSPNQVRFSLQNFGNVDTSTLPRTPAAKEVYASAFTTIFTCADSVPVTADLLDQALVAQGWSSFVAPDSESVVTDEMRMLDYRQGPATLDVYISLAPAQGGLTNVQYSTGLLTEELPWPADARQVEFSDELSIVRAQTSSDVESTARYYMREMKALGWTPNSLVEVLDDSARIVFGADLDRLVLLRLSRQDDATRIAIERISSDELVAMFRTEEPPAQEQAVESVVKSPEPPGPNARRLPLPPDARDVEYDAEDEEIRFTSPQKIRQLVKFFREELVDHGWSEEDGFSVITAQAATFELTGENDAELSFVLVKPGIGDEAIEVTISTSGLSFAESDAREPLAGEPGDPSPLDPESDSDAQSSTGEHEPGDEPLVVDNQYDVPLPSNCSHHSRERSPFRQIIEAACAAPLAKVLAFYREQMPAAGWKEQADKTQVADDKALLVFQGPAGTMSLKLTAGDETAIELSSRDRAAAEKQGVAPKPGKARVIFGNITEMPAKITFGGSPFTLAAGKGAEKPDGPGFDVPPGKYKIKVEQTGQPTQTETIVVEADQTWGALIGPGGVLPLQVY